MSTTIVFYFFNCLDTLQKGRQMSEGRGENFSIVEKTSALWRKLQRRGENFSVVEKTSASLRKVRRLESLYMHGISGRLMVVSSPSLVP